MTSYVKVDLVDEFVTISRQIRSSQLLASAVVLASAALMDRQVNVRM